jgi:hypothetical protein
MLVRRVGMKGGLIGGAARVPPREGNGKAALHVKVLGCRYVTLGDLTEDDARAEGCTSLAEYRKSWERFTRTKWDPGARVVVITFEPVEPHA